MREICSDRSAAAAEGLHPAAAVGEVKQINEHDIGPRLGQAQGHPLPEAARSAGDDGHLAVETEFVEYHFNSSLA
jgi:hypothetical protein